MTARYTAQLHMKIKHRPANHVPLQTTAPAGTLPQGHPEPVALAFEDSIDLLDASMALLEPAVATQQAPLVDPSATLMADAPSQPTVHQKIATDGEVTPEERMLRYAYRMGRDFGCSKTEIRVLQSIFVQYRSSATRKAIERLLQDGASVVEIEAAVACRQYWHSNAGFWDSDGNRRYYQRRFACNGSNQLSWPKAITTIRMFNGIPDSVEVEALLNTLFDRWISSGRLQSEFSSFERYLDVMASSVTADEIFMTSFGVDDDNDSYQSLTEWAPLASPEQQYLELHGRMPEYWYEQAILPAGIRTNWPNY